MKQEYRIAALVHSKLVADIVYRETLLLGWNISIEVTSYETALEDARRLFEEGYEVLLCHGGFREAVVPKNSDAARSSSSVRRSTSSKA